MPQPRDKSWFGDIARPSGTGSLSDTVGYLDRLIAGGDPTQRQFLAVGLKNQADRNKGNNNSNISKNNTLQTRKFNDKRTSGSKSPKVNVDDESWIADRKKKFPKISCVKENNDISLEKEATTTSTREAISNKKIDRKPAMKGKSNNDVKSQPKRRMTLFEKLIEMDQQTK